MKKFESELLYYIIINVLNVLNVLSPILSECVINMPHVVLYYTTLLKAISLRM